MSTNQKSRIVRLPGSARSVVEHPVCAVAFTLIEWLGVSAILPILAGLLLRAPAKAKEAGRIGCVSNLQQICLASVLYKGNLRKSLFGGPYIGLRYDLKVNHLGR